MSLSGIIISTASGVPDRIAHFLAQAKFFEVRQQVAHPLQALTLHLADPVHYFFVELNQAGDALMSVKSLKVAERPQLVIFGSEEIYFLDRGAVEPVLFDPVTFLPNLETVSERPDAAMLKSHARLQGADQSREMSGTALQNNPLWMQFQAVEGASRQPTRFSEQLYVRTEDGIKRLMRQDLLVIEAQKDYLQLTARQATYRVLRSLKSLEARLDPEVHCRVHRSYIVLLSAIHSLDQDYLWVDGIKEPIPIGPNYRKDLFGRLEII